MKYLLLSLILCCHFTFAACDTSQYREFDFWLGQWQVKSAASKQLSQSKITQINNGCGLLEEYKTPTGFQGKSLNIFDSQTQQWHQTWIDNTGYLLKLSGGIENNSMVMTGKTHDKNGNIILNKITWTPLKGGEVRQHWQTSTTHGKAWQTIFDGIYHKVPD
ncbi:MAG: hypothetical protein OQK09_03985 [Colwellia sp.]|nr:hypothetical protein [Colwellia sp.]MCW8866330.1 hypothetical protein [Colwellia sp.]MCW9080648.1 hypothetical protein [Colwellia sp.]